MIRYACNIKQRHGRTRCTSKDIRREYIEALVLDEMSKHIFDDSLIPFVLQYYIDFQSSQNGDFVQTSKATTSRIREIEKDINSLLDLLTKTSSKAMLDRLNAIESEKEELESRIIELKKNTKTESLSEKEISVLFYGARRMLREGSLKSIRMLIQMLVDKIVLFDDRVEIEFTFKNNSPLQADKIICDAAVNQETPETPVNQTLFGHFDENFTSSHQEPLELL